MIYKVKIRRNLDVAVREGAELVDGKSFNFELGWAIEDRPEYAGEVAMLPRDDKYPKDGPTWIASGDLELFNIRITEEQND